jgi:hypothetical protein
MSSVYITFDSYYDVDTYNSFKIAAKNNGIEFEEYLRVRAPFKRFLKIKDKKDLPSFVNYDFATSSDIKWLISVVKPVQPNEEYILKRRAGKDISYWNYILPKAMENADKEKYIMVFRATDFTELAQISKKLGDTKIYKWGRANGYNIYYCYNQYISGLISERNKLLEYGKEVKMSQARHHDSVMPKIKGDIEYNLNHFVLIKEKLENKTYESEYWKDGKIYPLKRATFI